MNTLVSLRLAALLVLLAPTLAACGDSQPPGGPPPPMVTVAKPVKRTVVDQDEYVGRFVAVDSVETRARVSGTLEAVHFKDGQIVNKGDLLFTIDRRPFQNALDQARANLLLAQSNLTYAATDLERARQLLRDKAISEQLFDQRVQAKNNAEASVAANEAAVRQAALDLEFTELRAPITGRIGDRRVSPGNLVTGGAAGTLLATIVSTDPIRFEFTFDEASLLRYDRVAKQSGELTTHGLSVPIKLRLIDESDFLHQGKMDFIDNAIDRSTGTIRARAVFANPDRLFIPGMFARVQIPGSAPHEALLVPDDAIGTDQTRKFVFVVGEDNAVKQAYVTLGLVTEGLRVIQDGLTPDARVVVNGLMRVRPGIKVTPQEQTAAPPGAAPSGT
ncbi:MAG: efflux RND transporter periplasmic adaptor subunit, partial [Xanthobacteraceae bacterium]